MSVSTTSGRWPSTASRSVVADRRTGDELDVVELLERADDPLAREVAVLAEDDARRSAAAPLTGRRFGHADRLPARAGSVRRPALDVDLPPVRGDSTRTTATVVRQAGADAADSRPMSQRRRGPARWVRAPDGSRLPNRKARPPRDPDLPPPVPVEEPEAADGRPLVAIDAPATLRSTSSSRSSACPRCGRASSRGRRSSTGCASTRLGPGRHGRRAGGLREDDAARAVGGPRRAAVRVGVGRRARQRPGRPAPPRRRGARARSTPLDPRVVDGARRPGESIWDAAVPRLDVARSRRAGALRARPRRRSELRSRRRDSAALFDAAHRSRRRTARCSRSPAASIRRGCGSPSCAPRAGCVEIGAEELALTRREATAAAARRSAASRGRTRPPSSSSARGLGRRRLYLVALALRSGRARRVRRRRPLPRRLLPRRVPLRAAAGAARRSSAARRCSRRCAGRSATACSRRAGRRASSRRSSGEPLPRPARPARRLVPLPRLFRDLLRRELGERSPSSCRCCTAGPPTGSRRTATASRRSRTPARRATSTASPASLAGLRCPTYDGGRVATVEGWLDRFDDDDAPRAVSRRRSPRRAGSTRSQGRARRGGALARRRRARRRRGTPAARPRCGLDRVVRAAICADGVERMLAGADAALAELAAEQRVAARTPLLVRGVAHVLLGDDATRRRRSSPARPTRPSASARPTRGSLATQRSAPARRRPRATRAAAERARARGVARSSRHGRSTATRRAR